MIRLLRLAYRAITVFGQSFQTVLLAPQFFTLLVLVVAHDVSTQEQINLILSTGICNVTTPFRYSSTNLSIYY